MAVDDLNGKLFLIDGAASALWSLNLDGSGLTLVKGGLTNYPTDLALDVLNQKIYFTTSSTIQNNNTVQRMDYTGNNNTVLFTATGPGGGGLPGNGVSRCTAIAVDLLNSKIFIADAGRAKNLEHEPHRKRFGGAGHSCKFDSHRPHSGCHQPAGLFYLEQPRAKREPHSAGELQWFRFNHTFYRLGRCPALYRLGLDLTHATIYLSDAGANTLWRIPTGSSSVTTVLGGLTATAKKVRWFDGPATRPPPDVGSIFLSGTSVVLNVTNGYIGGTYYMLTSTNLATPFSLWTPVSTNVLSASGNFSLTATNKYAASVPKQFFILRVQ